MINAIIFIIILLIKTPLIKYYIDKNPKASKFKVNETVRITKYKNILSKASPKKGQEKDLLSILFSKTNPWAY